MDPELVATRNCYQGWSADKQRLFLRQLAATGSVTRAAEAVGMTARAAYYLRNRPQAHAFREGWALALRAASDTLVAVAYDRAVHGARQKYWQDGKLVGERLVPSDRMLTWLLARIGPEIPKRAFGANETKWEDLERKLPNLSLITPGPAEEDEAWRIEHRTAPASEPDPQPDPQPDPIPLQPLSMPLPAPAETRAAPPARPRPRNSPRNSPRVRARESVRKS